MNKYKKLFFNTVILFLGTVGTKLLSYIMLPLYTRWLTTAEYGTAELIARFAFFFVPIVALGGYQGIFRYAADKSYDKKVCFSTTVLLTACSTLIALCFSPLLRLYKPFRGYEWLIILYVIASVWHYLLAHFVRGIGKMRLFTVQSILNAFLVAGLTVLFVFGMKLGLVGYVLPIIIGDVVTAVFLLFSAKIWQYFSFSANDRQFRKELLHYSLPLIPADVCWWITDLSDRFIVTHFCGEAVNGIYAVAYKIPTLVTLITGVFSQAWQSSAIEEAGNKDGYKTFFSEIYAGFASVIFLAGSGLIWLDRWISSWWYGADYYTAWQSVPWLLLATVFTSLVTFLGTAYMVECKSVQSFRTAAVGAASNVVLNLILIPRYAAIGAALATFISYVLVYVLRAVYTAHHGIKVQVLRTVLNTVLLTVQTLLLLAEVPHWFMWEALLVLTVGLLNVKQLWGAVRGIIKIKFAKKSP